MMSHSVNNNTRTGLVCLFVQIKSFYQFNPPEPPQILDIYSVVVLCPVTTELPALDVNKRLENKFVYDS